MNRLMIVLFLAACGGSSSTSDGATGDAAKSDGLSRCTDTGGSRALLVAITASDVVELYKLTPGKIMATGVRLTGISKPERIVMRDDGAEALVAWGGFGSPFGVSVISVTPDGSAASVKQTLPLGTDSTPVAIAYGDHDHAIIALAAMNDEVLGLTRMASGFVAGTRVAPPADYPLDLRTRPGSSDVLLSRAQVGADMTLDIYRMRAQADGTWKSTGAHASVPDYPIAMALHPSGNVLYVPSGDPQNPVTPSNLDGGGLLHAVTIGADAFNDAASKPLTRVGSLLAVDPGGHFVVTDGNIYMHDNNGNPNVYAYVWQTIRLDAGGLPTEVPAPSMQKDGLLFDDLEVSATGSLVAARELYPGAQPEAQTYPLELWAQPSWGAWELCDTALLSGGAHVAIAP
jgi:hypothetical protein